MELLQRDYELPWIGVGMSLSKQFGEIRWWQVPKSLVMWCEELQTFMDLKTIKKLMSLLANANRNGASLVERCDGSECFTVEDAMWTSFLVWWPSLRCWWVTPMSLGSQSCRCKIRPMFFATGTLKPPKTIVSDDGVGLERCWAQSTYNAADSLFVFGSGKVGMGLCDLLLGWCIVRLWVYLRIMMMMMMVLVLVLVLVVDVDVDVDVVDVAIMWVDHGKGCPQPAFAEVLNCRVHPPQTSEVSFGAAP